jgi:hypothetical protein
LSIFIPGCIGVFHKVILVCAYTVLSTLFLPILPCNNYMDLFLIF